MIPTIGANSLSNNNGNSNNGHSNNGYSNNGNSGQTCSSVMIGIASLILEGRAISDDEFVNPSIPSALMFAAALQHQITKNVGGNRGGGVVAMDFGGPQSPCSSSSANRKTVQNLMGGGGVGERRVEDTITTNHQRWTEKIYQLRQSSPSIVRDTYSPLTSEEKLRSEAQKYKQSSISDSGFEMITLTPLRHHYQDQTEVFPSSSISAAVGRKDNYDRPISILGSSSCSPPQITENFLYSLQSLATTCLRGSGNVAENYHYHHVAGGNTASGSTGNKHNYLPSTSTSCSSLPSSSKSPSTTSNVAATLKYNQLTTSPPPSSSSHCSVPYKLLSLSVVKANNNGCNNSSSNGSNNESSNNSSTSGDSKNFSECTVSSAAKTNEELMNFEHHSSCSTVKLKNVRFSAKKSNKNDSGCGGGVVGCSTDPSLAVAPATTAPPTKTKTPPPTTATITNPQRGPHCDQFLKRIGLAKGGDAAEAEEHICDTTHANSSCSHWRAYSSKMEEIVSKSQPICIEVYLGPVGHKILLEQWIITQKDKDKLPSTSMTLPSLCSAIRSQLYFSQISAWCDLIKKSDRCDMTDSGRIKFYNSSTSGSGSSVGSVDVGCCSNSALHSIPNNMRERRPHLNIYYHIKQYDSTASFNSKPNVHHFPDVNVDENFSISVCLKSLPRINGGIPRIIGGIGEIVSSTIVGGTPLLLTNAATNVATSLIASEKLEATNLITTTSILKPIKGNDKWLSVAACREKGKHKCQLAEEDDEQEEKEGEDDESETQDEIRNDDNDCIGDFEDFGIDVASTLFNSSTKVATSKFVATFEATDSSCSSFGSSSATATTNLTHRERQLQKYRKRMLRRDKRAGILATEGPTGGTTSAGRHQKQPSPMQLDSVKINFCDNEDNTKNGCKQTVSSEFSSASSPSVSTTASIVNVVEMISIGTQTMATATTINLPMNCCDHCGNEKSFVCLNCDNGCDDMDASSSPPPTKPTTSSSLFSLQRNHSPRSTHHHLLLPGKPAKIAAKTTTTVNKADLLLQAIQRTPSRVMKKKKAILRNDNSINHLMAMTNANAKDRHRSDETVSNPATSALAIATVTSSSSMNGTNGVNHVKSVNSCGGGGDASDNVAASSSSAESTFNDCQVCKRQKIQHNFFRRKDFVDAAIDGDDGSDSMVAVAGSSSSSSKGATGHFVITNNNNNINNNCNGSNNSSSNNKNNNNNNNNNININNNYHHHDNHTNDSSTKYSLVVERRGETGPGKSAFGSCGCSSSSSGIGCNVNPTIRMDDDDEQHTMRSHNNTAISYSSKTSPEISTTSTFRFATHFKTPNATTTTTTSRDTRAMPSSLSSPLPSFNKQIKPNILQITSAYNFINGCDNNCSGSCSKNHSNGIVDIHSNSNGNSNKTHQQMQHNCLSFHRKLLPKVNLTTIFCNSHNPLAGDCGETLSSPSFPPQSSSAAAAASDGISAFPFDNINETLLLTDTNNTKSVQKSHSAPTLPNSPSAAATVATPPVSPSLSATTTTTATTLSPRFAKQAAIYKRRSRHLSDRSDRSSFGSDEQFSDDDFENNCSSGGSSSFYSPTKTTTTPGLGMGVSPIKHLTSSSSSGAAAHRPITTTFGRGGSGGIGCGRPLLGNLEESLLQKRLIPKIEASGFKVLLGASGGFCPTQLTIPAAAYFYELHGQTLNTPYVCEIRLPRKGYSIPRSGTVQVTLLNPTGTVVRMFVIPYDFRDMPPLHQTFIRQRILADNAVTNVVAATATATSSSSSSSTTTAAGGGATLTDTPPRQQQQQQQHNGNSRNNKNCYSISPRGGGGLGVVCANGNPSDGFSENNRSINSNNSSNNYNNTNGSRYHRLSPNGGGIGLQSENNLGHFISPENMRRLRYSIHLRFQTSRSGRLTLHTDIRLLISRRTDCDTAAAYAKSALEAPNHLIIDTVMPNQPKYSARQENPNKI